MWSEGDALEILKSDECKVLQSQPNQGLKVDPNTPGILEAFSEAHWRRGLDRLAPLLCQKK